ncbi:MAG: periplasmic heavy metal sensor [Candidatus Solibacter usitatus]|nr:periplasmic heavy metal sensor [Candidatus Solibacter usitatus]
MTHIKFVLPICLMTGSLLAQGPAGAGPGWGVGPGPGFQHGQAGRARMAGAMGGGAGLDALKQSLGLTDQQVERLRGLRKEQMQSLRPQAEKIRDNRRALAEAMRSANPDAGQVGQLMVEQRKLAESLRGAHKDRGAGALAILTPEQQARLRALQDAQALLPAARQAAALGLIAPAAGEGAARMDRMGGRRMGPPVR